MNFRQSDLDPQELKYLGVNPINSMGEDVRVISRVPYTQRLTRERLSGNIMVNRFAPAFSNERVGLILDTETSGRDVT